MKVGARELRIEAARVMEKVQRGHDVTITYRKVPVAVIKPLKPTKQKRAFEPIGFGLRAGRKDIVDVAGWVRKVRRPRYTR